MPAFRTLSDSLCISREALLACVNLNTLEAAIKRSKLRPVLPGWYAWEGVPKRWRGDIEGHWCGGQPAEQWWGRQSVAVQLKAMLPPARESDIGEIMSAGVKRERVDVSTGEVWEEGRGSLPPADRRALVEATRWLRLVQMLDQGVCKEIAGKNRKKLIEQHLLPLLKAEKVKVPGSYRRLLAKAQEYEERGIVALIPGYYGNQNRTKVADEQMSLLVTLYADPRKPTIDRVWNMYNELASSLDWEGISLRSVRRHLRRPEVAQLWTLSREGLSEWRKNYGYTFYTKRPSMPDLLWVHDGTKVNYFYRDSQGRRAARLNVVVVIDAHSYYILGWAFGTQAENTEMVRSAVRSAVREANGRMPMQYLYDNGSANTSFFKTWPAMHRPSQPNRGQSKPIEAMFGQLQQYVMRRHSFFTGQNITARGQRGKLNKDAIPAVGDLLSLEGVIQEAELDFSIWNETPKKVLGGRTPAEAYCGGHRIETMTVSPEIERECFWMWHCDQRGNRYEKRWQGTRLALSLGDERYHYEVCGGDGLPDAEFYRLHQGTALHVKYDPEDPGRGLALYLPGDRFLALAQQRYQAPRAVGDYKDGDASSIRKRLVYQQQQIAENRRKVADMMAHLDSAMDDEELSKLDYLYVDKETLSRAEESMLRRQARDHSDQEAPLPENEELTKPDTVPDRKETNRKSALDYIHLLDEHYHD